MLRHLVLARPGALALLLALVPVILLYFLRMRFRRKSVGSTYLWKELLAATTGGDAIRRRSLLLLLLQIAAILLVALAASGPTLEGRRLLKPGTVFLIDLSASMGTRDAVDAVAPAAGKADSPASRVEAAAAAVRKEMAALDGDVPVMIFALSSTALPLLPESSLDRGAAIGAMRGLRAGSASLSEGPCAEIISAWLARNAGSWQACLVTDGGLDLGGRRLAEVFGGALKVISVGSSGDSLAVTGLKLESGDTRGLKADFTLWNGWPAEKTPRVRITKAGEELGSGLVQAGPGWSRHSLELRGRLEEGSYEIRVEREGGPSSAPGQVYRLALYQRPALSILLVGRKDPFLRAALAYSGISYTSSPDFPAEPGAADIIIAEAVTVPPGLKRQLLVFGDPPPDAPVYTRGGTSGAIVSTEPNHLVSRFVSWEGARAEGARAYALRGEALVLATAGGAPVLAVWEREGYRSMACGIDLARSDLGLKSAFPVLLQNFIQWCIPRVDAGSALTLVAGESARRAESRSFTARGIELQRSGPTVTLTAREEGLFEWSDGGQAGSPPSKGFIAANVPAGELDIAPRRIQSPGTRPLLASTEQSLSRPLGAWLILLFLVCLAAEWLAWKGKA